MKSVLFIAYFFPPEGSAGSYRPLRFVRQLSKIGWRTSVVSASPYQYERYDPVLLGWVPSETEVVRVCYRDPWQAIQAWRGKEVQKKLAVTSDEIAEEIRTTYYKPFRSRIRAAVNATEAWYYHPDIARRWIRPAIKTTVQMSTHKRPDVVWATAGPVSAWIVAQEAAERTGVPYVLDLRDPHGLSYYEAEEKWPGWAKRRVYRAMHTALKKARAVVFLFESVAECYLRAFPGALDAKKIYIIPNGYDGTIEKIAPPKADECIVLYSGTVSSYRYDTFLQALRLLKGRYPDQANRLRIHFVGEGADAVMRDSAALGISEIVKTRHPVPQSKITCLQREAHAFLVLGRPATMKGYELVAGAKLFEYLKARRPIIGVLPQDEGKKILLKLGISTIADVDSPSQIVSVLRRLVDVWSAGMLSVLLPDRAAVEIYSVEQQVTDLVCALEGKAPAVPFIPGCNEIPPSLHGSVAARIGDYLPA
jgi:glycosyltransferase involved in cell wall biosynthesis